MTGLKPALAAFVAGLLFAVGLVVGGMTQPSKVVGFLDFFGDWDPSLAFVMGGAVLVHGLALFAVVRRARPVLTELFEIPSRRDISPALLGGAALFGIGWALAGFCPGPGLVALASFSVEPLVFVVAMGLGMLVFEGTRGAGRVAASEPASASPPSAP